MDKKILLEIGMTDNEANVYLTLLKLNSSTTTKIVKESKVHASKIYSILGRLIEKGLATTIKKGKKTYYQASDPDMIKIYLNEKQNKINNQINQVDSIIPALRALNKSNLEEEEVKVFFGWKGLEAAFRDILRVLKRGETQYVIGATYIEEIPIHNRFFQNLRKERDKLGIKTKIIFSKVAKGKLPVYEKSKFTQIKYIDENIPTSIDIYKNKVIISMMKKRPLVIQIKSQEIADSFIAYFRILWKK